MTKQYIAIAKDDSKLPDNPYAYWVKGKSYDCIISKDTISIMCEDGFYTYYKKEIFELLKEIFDFKECECNE